MYLPAAYLSVILIWSTTPLAIKWSSEGVSFLFGALSRMTLGLLCVLALCALRRELPRLDREAFKAYGTAAIGIFPGMFCVYWGAQFIPSGWIAVIFGLSPILTAGLAALLLGERSLTPVRVLAQLCGLAGLAIVFAAGRELGPAAVLGIGAVLFSTCCHTLSAVLMKRLASTQPASAIVAGGLACALPGYLLCWALFDGRWPQAVPPHALAAIAYLGVIATTAGFTLYYFILQRLRASQVALITLISPLAALFIGKLLNDEPLQANTLLGAGLILVGLALHEVLPAWRAHRARTVARAAPVALGELR